jgi:hypothetical protein
MIKGKSVWVYAYKLKEPISADKINRTVSCIDGTYYAEKIIEDIERFYDGLEYGDVSKGEYQIWEYPSGRIFRIDPDREVDEKNYYSVRYTTKGTIWLPKLRLVKTDKQRVEEIFSFLSITHSKKRSLLERLRSFCCFMSDA